jgi:hypothetical protein
LVSDPTVMILGVEVQRGGAHGAVGKVHAHLVAYCRYNPEARVQVGGACHSHIVGALQPQILRTCCLPWTILPSFVFVPRWVRRRLASQSSNDRNINGCLCIQITGTTAGSRAEYSKCQVAVAVAVATRKRSVHVPVA